mmetsp:Transcript_39165/g.126672  ORF Transcript_39165/g.126672 Transcript_39165/m.126672 type:complete len:241 (+) Transcript_39165:80-802(+)
MMPQNLALTRLRVWSLRGGLPGCGVNRRAREMKGGEGPPADAPFSASRLLDRRRLRGAAFALPAVGIVGGLDFVYLRLDQLRQVVHALLQLLRSPRSEPPVETEEPRRAHLLAQFLPAVVADLVGHADQEAVVFFRERRAARVVVPQPQADPRVGGGRHLLRQRTRDLDPALDLGLALRDSPHHLVMVLELAVPRKEDGRVASHLLLRPIAELKRDRRDVVAPVPLARLDERVEVLARPA